MSEPINITSADILQQVKLSGQIPTIIEGIVTRKIVLSKASEIGLKVETEELQQVADNIRLTNNLKSADETWAWLQKNSLSLDDFEEIVYLNVISGKLAQHLFADKIEPWFVEHLLDYSGAVIYEVVLDDQDLAMELFFTLQEGEMIFPEVAHKYIQETELRRCGGYRGVVTRKQLKPEISAAVFAANPPQILKPIITAKGVHLILVEEIIKPELDNKLCVKIISDLFSEWLKCQSEELEIATKL